MAAGKGNGTLGGSGPAGKRAGRGLGKARAVGQAALERAAGKPLRVRRRWTAERQAAFLEHLSRTCSISHALTMVAMTNSGLHHLRQRDPAFRDRFAEALQMGYQQVEADLLAHALAHGAAVEQGETGAVAVPAFDADFAIKLLQFRERSGRDRREGGGPAVKRASEREIEDELVSKLKGLARRLALIA